MADISYGMGQYRYNKDTKYLNLLKDTDSSEEAIKYYISDTVFKYRDVAIDLSYTPGVNLSPVNGVFYGNDYFLQLDIPRNKQYYITINLKLCAENANQEIDRSKYQQLKQITINPISITNDIYKDIILFSYNENTDIVCFLKYLPENVTINETNESYSISSADIAKVEDNTVYRDKNNINYYYIKKENNECIIYKIDTTKKKIYTLEKEWDNINNNTTSVFHFDLAFSPKYNLNNGYKYLLLEIDRNSIENQTLQYVDSGQTYYGTFLDRQNISYSLYSVKNLIGIPNDNNSPEIATESNNLNHIGVWGHPEQILIINGEEIKIGRNGFYELNDYKITRLGVINDANVDDSNFIIDYEYQISN